MNTEQMNKYTAVANEIGISLCSNAISYDGKCNWLHSTNNENGREIFRPMDFTFYEGTSGIAFFLFNLYSITGEKIFLTTAQGAIKQSLQNADEIENPNSIAFYTGKAGLAYVLLKAAEQLNSNEHFLKATTLLEQIKVQQVETAQFDIMHGLAGAIPLFIYAEKMHDIKNLIKVSITYAEHLLANAISSNNTLSWNYQNENHKPHTGFGHGSSGMAYAFALLYKFTDDEKFKTACTASLAYEDMHFNAQRNNWKNIEEVNANVQGEDDEQYQSLWCYGAAGMGMARLAAWQLTGKEQARTMAMHACKIAKQSIKQEQNFSLCHGHFSNAELLLLAADVFKNENYFNEAIPFAELGYKTIFEKEREWPCGNKTLNASPAFMTGTAGIGNFYLRMANKNNVASGLILEEFLK